MSPDLTAGCAALAMLAVVRAVVGGAGARRCRRTRSPWWLRRCGAAGRRPRRRGRVDLAGMFDRLARDVRAGGALGPSLAAWCADAPVVPAALAGAAARHGRGVALADACRPAADDAEATVALAGATLCALARCGAASGRALDAAAAALRERDALAAEVRAHAATARLSATVLVLLPLGFAAWSVAGDPSARAFLVGSPVGLAVAAAGLSLDALGAWWMRRLIVAAVRP